MKLFFDTSALIKRYFNEPGSGQVNGLLTEADDIAVSIICLPEMISTLQRLVREKKISRELYAILKAEILKDIEDMEVVTLDPLVIGRSVECLENSAVRAIDALHVACSLVVEAELFISADLDQLKAAKQAGLKVTSIN